jgi:diaminopimelate epimerase
VNIAFLKMCGAGNDMILIDHRPGFLRGREEAFARAVCERRYGIGADVLVLLEEDEETQFLVRFFNPDGGEYGLCGNGVRGVPLFAQELGFPGPRFTFRSSSGVHEGAMVSERTARVRLAPVREMRFDIPVEGEEGITALDWGDIGVPHAAVWVRDVSGIHVAAAGARLRNHPAFAPHGTNVSFLERTGPDHLLIRTFERGVEGETLACGSGSAVAATLARARGIVGDRVRFVVRSGEELVVHLAPGDGLAPELEGPIDRSFEGTVEAESILERDPEAR